MLTSAALLERARLSANAGRHRSARNLLRLAQERVVDDDDRARIDATLAYVESELGEVERGFHLCNSAVERAISPSVLGAVLGQRGLLSMRAGESDSALADFERAISLIDADPETLGRVHLNRGVVHLQMGSLAGALSDFEIARSAYETVGLSIECAKTVANLGYTKLLMGDLVGSLTAMEEATPILASLSSVAHATADQDLAEVLLAAGRSTEAADLLARAANAFGSKRLGQSQGEAELILARSLQTEDPRRAATIARRAARRFRTRGSEVWALRADAVALMSEVEGGEKRLKRAASALALVARLEEKSLRDDAVDLSLHAARIHLRRADPESARKCLVTTHSSSHIRSRALAREVRSELAATEGRRGQALAHVRRGLTELHAWQSSFGSLDLQSSLVGHGRRLALQGMRLALDDGRPDLVFEWSERARALVSRVAPVRPPSDPRAAADLAELRHLQAQARESELPTALARREGELRARIRQRAWYDEGSREVVEPSSVEEVRAQLVADDAALAAYLVVDDRVHALVLAPDGVVVRDLGRFAPVHALLDGMLADLDMSAASLPETMRAAVRAGLQERLEALATHLIEPLTDTIGEHRLVVTPSGALAGTPWTMLPGLVGRPVTIPRSASIWLQRRQVPLRLDSAGFVAGPHVPRAEEEVHKAASAWSRARIVSGSEATAAAVSDLAHDVDVLHVSAHGRHSADNPLFSGLELVGGPWFGYDIDQLDRIPQAVILSACELGRSTVRWGEESIGMTAAWLHAGTHCVIGSPASVADDVACEVLGETHQLMADGMPPADALARASVRTLDPLPAPFQCFGTGW